MEKVKLLVDLNGNIKRIYKEKFSYLTKEKKNYEKND
jgi:hypothetical protein